MLDSERAARYAVLLKHAGKRWRDAVPVDGTVARLSGDGLPRVRIGGHVLTRDLVGEWRVTAAPPARPAETTNDEE